MSSGLLRRVLGLLMIHDDSKQCKSSSSRARTYSLKIKGKCRASFTLPLSLTNQKIWTLATSCIPLTDNFKKFTSRRTGWSVRSCCCWWVKYFVCTCRSQRPKCCHWRIGLSPEIRTFSSNTLGDMPHAQISKQWQTMDAECRERTAQILQFRMMIAPKLSFPPLCYQKHRSLYSLPVFWRYPLNIGWTTRWIERHFSLLSSVFPTH